VLANASKYALFGRYVRRLEFDAGDLAALTALQPALDVAYAAGVVRGLGHLRAGERATIS
jgi:hypothetical protein